LRSTSASYRQESARCHGTAAPAAALVHVPPRAIDNRNVVRDAAVVDEPLFRCGDVERVVGHGTDSGGLVDEQPVEERVERLAAGAGAQHRNVRLENRAALCNPRDAVALAKMQAARLPGRSRAAPASHQVRRCPTSYGRPDYEVDVRTQTHDAGDVPERDDKSESGLRLGEIVLIGATKFLQTAFTADELERLFAGSTPATARDFFVARTMVDVQRYGVSARRWARVEQQLRPDNRYDTVEAESLYVERVAWQRRLLEALVTLVNFSTTNDNAYYNHYLALQELERQRYLASDERDFFGANSELTNRNIAKLKQQVDDTRTRLIAAPDCWYLKRNEHYRLASARSQYLRALGAARGKEKTWLGYTYHLSFGAASERLHFGVLDAQGGEMQADRAASAMCGLIALGIVARAHELCGVEPAGVNKVLVRRAADDTAPALLAPIAQPGDFVLTTGPHIAEVLEVQTTDFGYTRYRVSFLDAQSGPGIDEDWLPALAVRLFMTQNEIIDGIKRRFAEHPIPGFGFTDSDVMDAARDAVVEGWRMGLRTYFIGQIEEERANNLRERTDRPRDE